VEAIPDLAVRFGLDETELSDRLETARERLYEVRAQRIWPGLDDKVLIAWNGLMMAAFAEAARVLDRVDYAQIAAENAQFIDQNMRTEDGRLLRTWKAGSAAKYNAYLEDYAYLADGLLALYQTTFNPRWFEWVQELTQQMLTHFHDQENGGFYDTSDDHEELLYRPKELQDNATPSGNSMAVQVLLKNSLFTGDGGYWDVAQEALDRMSGFMDRYPTGFAHWLSAAAFTLGDPREVAIVGPLDDVDTMELVDALNNEYRPNLVLAAGEEVESVPLLANRQQVGGRPTDYVCRRFVCKTPVTDTQSLLQQLD
jgi:uncharacterized protein YyaL (SSP411 family)